MLYLKSKWCDTETAEAVVISALSDHSFPQPEEFWCKP